MLLAAIPFPDIDPVAISIWKFQLRWYALAYIAGLILGWRYAVMLVRNQKIWASAPTISKTQIDDLLFWAAIGVVAGGRLGYVLVYYPSKYLADPLQIFALWEGGMSFHGGALGVLVAILLFARANGLSFLSLADVVTAAAPIGLFFGRIANFINSELWGRPTDVSWGVIFPNGGPLPRHPSQLYEAVLEGILLFIFLRVLTHVFKALHHPGTVFGGFIFGYGVGRTVAEFFREPDAQLGFLYGGWLTMGMVLSIPMALVGLAIMVWAWRRPAPGTVRSA